jgi:hypothetical protein
MTHSKKNHGGQQLPRALNRFARSESAESSGTSLKQAPKQSSSFLWNVVRAGANV